MTKALRKERSCVRFLKPDCDQHYSILLSLDPVLHALNIQGCGGEEIAARTAPGEPYWAARARIVGR